MIAIVLSVVIIAVVAMFSVQNAEPVTITFLIWTFQASLAIVIFLSVLSGVLIAALISISGKIRKYSGRRKDLRRINPQGEQDNK